MKCPPELFDIAPDMCHYCHHSKDMHNDEAEHACDCGCSYFEVYSTKELIAKLEADATPANPPQWHDINPKLMQAKLPETVIRFASLMDTPKGREFEAAHSLQRRFQRELNKDKAKHECLNVGDIVIGSVEKAGATALVLGVVKADNELAALPSMILKPSGVHYELDGLVITSQLKQLKGFWGHPSLLCKDVVRVDKFAAILEEAVGNMPYKAAKEILG